MTSGSGHKWSGFGTCRDCGKTIMQAVNAGPCSGNATVTVKMKPDDVVADCGCILTTRYRDSGEPYVTLLPCQEGCPTIEQSVAYAIALDKNVYLTDEEGVGRRKRRA